MFTKQRRCGLFYLHPFCGILVGAALATGLGVFLIGKRGGLSCMPMGHRMKGGSCEGDC